MWLNGMWAKQQLVSLVFSSQHSKEAENKCFLALVLFYAIYNTEKIVRFLRRYFYWPTQWTHSVVDAINGLRKAKALSTQREKSMKFIKISTRNKLFNWLVYVCLYARDFSLSLSLSLAAATKKIHFFQFNF